MKFTPNYFIVEGDMNVGLNIDIDRYGSGGNNEKSAQWLNKFLLENSFVDV